MKLRTDAFEALAVLVRPVGFDTEAVGDLPADVIDQSLQRMKSTPRRMGHGVDVGVGQIIEMVTDMFLIGFRKPRCAAVNQQSQYDLAGAWRDYFRLGSV